MAYEQIIYEVADNIATITLNRPEKLNAFTGIMMNEMLDAFDKADADDNVRAVIVTGAGRAFCAGADLSAGPRTFDASREDRPERKSAIKADGTVDWSNEGVRDGGGRLTLRIFECLKPVIAAVNGPAVGVGVTMQLAMDVRLASENARFGFVFARRGIVPEACSSWFLPKIVGISQALEWTFTGRVFPAEEALEGGLDQKDLQARSVNSGGAGARARDCRQHVASVGRADSPDAVEDGRRGPSDGSAQSRQPRNLRAWVVGGCERGRRVVPGKASGKISGQGLEGHARRTFRGGRSESTARTSRFATDDDADFAGVLDLDDGALVVEVQLRDAADHFDLASAWILESRDEYLGRGAPRLDTASKV